MADRCSECGKKLEEDDDIVVINGLFRDYYFHPECHTKMLMSEFSKNPAMVFLTSVKVLVEKIKGGTK